MCWIHRDGLPLLDHVLGIVEGLQDEHLNHTDNHADGGILQFVQFRRHVVVIVIDVGSTVVFSIQKVNTSSLAIQKIRRTVEEQVFFT